MKKPTLDGADELQNRVSSNTVKQETQRLTALNAVVSVPMAAPKGGNEPLNFCDINTRFCIGKPVYFFSLMVRV